MPGPVPFYGSRQDPTGRGTLVRDKNGREFLFTGPAVEGFDKYDQLGGFAPADPAAGVAAVQDTRVAGTPHEPPPVETPTERFDRLDKLGTGPRSAPVPPRSSAPAAFARSAAASALDTAALPVTVPARLYRAAGGRGETLDTIADLSADEALQDATWLATGEDAGPYRERVAREREEFPNASAAGTEFGSSLPLVALGPAARGLRLGATPTRAALAAAAQGALEAPASVQRRAYTEGRSADDAEVLGAMGSAAATGAAMNAAQSGAAREFRPREGKEGLFRSTNEALDPIAPGSRELDAAYESAGPGELVLYRPGYAMAAAEDPRPGVLPGRRTVSAQAASEQILGSPLDGKRAHELLGMPRFGKGTRVVAGNRDGQTTLEVHVAKPNGEAELQRTFYRDDQGKLVVQHDMYKQPTGARSSGEGSRVLANQIEQYRKLGVDRIEGSAAWDGRYVWPRMGFDTDPDTLIRMQRDFNQFQERSGFPVTPVRKLKDIADAPGGKEFLLSQDTYPMHLDLSGEGADRITGYLSKKKAR